MTFEVRAERDTDRESVRHVITAAFGRDDPAHGEEVAQIWEALGRHRRTGLVAEEGGAVVGHVGLSLAWVDARRQLAEMWMRSPLSVLPERQQAGLGTALVARAVETHEPWMTGQLIYPAVWWEHGCVGLRDPRLAEVEERFAALD